MTIDEIFQHAQEAAKTLFEKQGAIHPMWICETGNGKVLPIIIQMPDRDDRPSVAKELRESFQRHNVQRYASILEAWTLIMPNEAEVNKGYSGSLENHPDRREVVFISAEDKDGSTRSGLFYILRPEHKKPTLSPFESFEKNKTGGTFTRLLATETQNAGHK